MSIDLFKILKTIEIYIIYDILILGDYNMNSTSKDVIDCIRYVSTILSESGSETYSIEENIEKILISQGFITPNVFSTSTGIFLSFHDDLNNSYTEIIRVKKRGTNLNNIYEVNNLIDNLINNNFDIVLVNKTLKSILCPNKDKKITLLKILSAGISSSFFTLLYGGIVYDYIIAFICGIVIQLVSISFKRVDIFHFANSFICGLLTAIIACIGINIFKDSNFDKIIIGSIMPILPGLALTNSIKDTITGNLVSRNF